MQRGHHQVACLASLQCNFDGFAVAHLADEDHFGRLPQRRAQCQRKTRRVGMQFALVNRGFFVAMQEFDGVLDSEDVTGLFCIHLVQDGSERG